MSSKQDSAPGPRSTLADTFGRLGRELTGEHTPDEVFRILSRRAYDLIPAAEHAAISRGRPGRFETIGETSDLPPLVDKLQYAANSGPCVDAILDDAVYRVGELATTRRWPEFGRQAAAQFDIHSMLSVRIFLEDDEQLAGINLYSSRVDAFDESDEVTAVLLATHGGLALTAARRHETVANLRRALDSNRPIAAAIGILMATNKITYEQSFDLLRIASQARQRKLVEIAEGVLLTGALDLPAAPEPRRRD